MGVGGFSLKINHEQKPRISSRLLFFEMSSRVETHVGHDLDLPQFLFFLLCFVTVDYTLILKDNL